LFGEGFDAPRDFGEEVAGFEFEVMMIEGGHEDGVSVFWG
jgi:hypothetical protein